MKPTKNKGLLLSAALCLGAVAVMLLSLTCWRPRVQGEFVPPAFAADAEDGLPKVPEELGWTELDAGAFRAAVCGAVKPHDGKADIWLTNPGENEVWLKLRMLGPDGALMGETGLILPGQYVQSVTLVGKAEPGMAVTLKIMAYEPETYHSAGSISVNTQIS